MLFQEMTTFESYKTPHQETQFITLDITIIESCVICFYELIKLTCVLLTHLTIKFLEATVYDCVPTLTKVNILISIKKGFNIFSHSNLNLFYSFSVS
jgi:hypothetical protein